MISKRSFFKKLGAVIAAVAIAPEIAFGRKLELPEISVANVWERSILTFGLGPHELKRLFLEIDAAWNSDSDAGSRFSVMRLSEKSRYELMKRR